MQNLEYAELITLSSSWQLKQFMSDIDDCISDIDYFIKTLSSLKDKALINPDEIGSMITHYATNWLPELFLDHQEPIATPQNITVSLLLTKKRLFIETLIGILSRFNIIPCNFLLRLLRVANTAQVGLVYVSQIEKRVSLLLDRASLKELRFFSCGILLLLVRAFVTGGGAARSRGGGSGAAGVKVAELVDCYLAEAANDGSCEATMVELVEIASTIPGHARLSDDGLYRVR